MEIFQRSKRSKNYYRNVIIENFPSKKYIEFLHRSRRFPSEFYPLEHRSLSVADALSIRDRLKFIIDRGGEDRSRILANIIADVVDNSVIRHRVAADSQMNGPP